MVRRTRWELYLKILQILHNKEGISKTVLMDKVNTTHEDLTSFLSHLQKKGLVEIVSGRGRKIIVRITEKGEEIFKESRELMTKIEGLLE